MAVREVQKLKSEYLRPLNQGLISEGAATPFESFVLSVYTMTEMALMASSTQDRYRGIIDHYLVPTFGSMCLRDITPLTLQKYILGFQIKEPEKREHQNPQDGGAGKWLSRESVDKIRDVLSSILGSAVKYGFLVKNPADGVTSASEAGHSEAQAVHPARAVRRIDRADSGTLLHHGFCGGLHGVAGQRIDCTAME